MPIRISPSGVKDANPKQGDEVVITGLSGSFPDSDGIYEFRDNLMNKIDMINDDHRRWYTNNPKIPQRSGKIFNVEKFDADFFGMSSEKANKTCPMGRILLERTYEAIIDAGFHPKELQGTRTGVFVGVCFSESERKWYSVNVNKKEDSIVPTIEGCNRSMLANRISYWFNFKGPSYSIDTACASSSFALEHAYRAIRDNTCDYAIVGGTNLSLAPLVTMQFALLGVLSLDGQCRPFDNEGDGYVRSEAIVAILLQRAKDSRRIYATVCHAKTNCDGFKPEGITYPSSKLQRKLLEAFYKECPIPPETVAYVEAHGTGTKVGDPEEAITIDNTFCKNRKTPLKIGSVKSNIGHTEAASGLCSVAKVIIAFETGIIPPNLNFQSPRKEIKALTEGRLEVVTKPTSLEGSYVPINSFGFGGANCHFLLKKCEKEKRFGGAPDDDIPRLVCVSGRTYKAVKFLLNDIESRPLDEEFVRLLQEVHKYDTVGHNYRGFILLQKNEPRAITKEIDFFSKEKRPVWFIFSGIGFQWSGMGLSFLKIPVFTAAIQRCDKVLAPRGIDIVKIITSNDPHIFDNNLLYAFVGIAAVQIGLIDILTQLGIVPDNMIGYSIGELGCAYADKCITAEQMILAAYLCGINSMENEPKNDVMFEVALGHNEILKLTPKEIDIIAHNDSSCCTISGPKDKMLEFINSLKEKRVNVNEIKVSKILHHSRNISKTSTRLLKELSQVITVPKLRSARWISSSLPKTHWTSKLAKFASAEYFVNNYQSSVLFKESCQEIPPNAITIEIGPNVALQTILKHSLPSTTINMVSALEGKDNVNVLLSTVGRIYKNGLNPNLINFYPKVNYPVSRGTPMIAPIIKWNHSDDRFVVVSDDMKKSKSGEKSFIARFKDPEYGFIAGHVIDGRTLYPATGYLYLVWKSFSLMHGLVLNETSVVFENVRFLRSTNISEDSPIKFTITIQKGTGKFEITESNVTIADGQISFENILLTPMKDILKMSRISQTNKKSLNSCDIYKELRLRGYNYKGLFRGIIKTECNNMVADIQWKNNFVAFMDNMLQVQILNEDTRNLYVPISIGRITIHPLIHKKFIFNSESNSYIKTYYNKECKILRAGGIEMHDLRANSIQRRKNLGDPVLERQIFVPYMSPEEFEIRDALKLLVQITLENSPAVKVKTIEMDSNNTEPLAVNFHNVLNDLPLIQAETIVISNREIELPSGITVEPKLIDKAEAMYIIDSNLLTRPEALNLAVHAVKKHGYIISREHISSEIREPAGFSVRTQVQTSTEKLILLEPTAKVEYPISFAVVEISSKFSFQWIEEVKKVLQNKQPLIIYSYEHTSGIIGFVNCLRKEETGDQIIKAFWILDSNVPKFDPNCDFYKKQLSKNVVINIYKNGQWGCLRHLNLQTETVNTEYAYIDLKNPGDLSALAWYEGPTCTYSNDNIVDVYYAALNFRDIMITTGKLKTDFMKQTATSCHVAPGLEYSGRNKNGDRVMGMVPSGGVATKIKCDPKLLWKVPDKWTLEEAATVPVVYGTVYYALVYKGKLRRGQSILIHAGSGGVGQAAISIALSYGCDIFTTVGTSEKRTFIREKFPLIPESHIGNSRDTSFEQMVRHETKGKGVDIIINSLAEEKLQASIRCLATSGKFFEIGKYDLQKNNIIGMKTFLKNITFYGIMLDNLFYASDEIKISLHKIFKEGIENGTVQPLVRNIFKRNEIEQAFRFMATGKHIGKVLIKIRPEEGQLVTIPKALIIPAIPQMFCESVHSIIIVGGLGGFGLELSNWLISRGLKNLTLSSRNGITKGYQEYQISKWRSLGINIQICTANVTTLDGCKEIIETANKMGPVFAIFNLAAVLRDGLFYNQTINNFEVSFEGKVYGTENLDELSRSLCPNLKHFVVFSSVSCGRGNAGQTNYGMANSVMESICEKRKADGLPALAIQWGAIGEVGLVADMQDNDTLLEIGGTLQQKINSCLEVLDTFLRQDSPVVASMVVAEKIFLNKGESIVTSVANILGIRDIKSISMHCTLTELGMDSMTGVEIKQILERDYEIFLTPQDIRSLTFAKLVDVDNSSKIEKSNSSLDENINQLFRTLGKENLNGQKLIPIPSMISTTSDICPVFFIPGLEGQCSVFENVCKTLKVRALGLQMSFDNTSSTIDEITEVFLSIIKTNLKPDDMFKLVAFSYGSLIAIEITSRLETEGYKGKVIIIDGSPTLLKNIANNQFGNVNDVEVENRLLCDIVNLLTRTNIAELKMNLAKYESWDAKMNFTMSKVPKDIKYSQEYIQSVFDGCLKRIRSISNYQPTLSKKIKSPVHLIRPSQPTVGNIAEDYELSNFFETPSLISIIEGNHFSILDNSNLNAIINEFFNSDE